MQRHLLAASALTTAVGLVLAVQAPPARAASMEKCYGINAVAKNDCAAGTHSCAGQATKARDPQSFVLLPAGDCAKIAGGKTKPS